MHVETRRPAFVTYSPEGDVSGIYEAARPARDCFRMAYEAARRLGGERVELWTTHHHDCGDAPTMEFVAIVREGAPA